MDALLLAGGVASASLSLGAGIWETVLRSRRRADEPSGVEVVVSGTKAHLTSKQREAVVQILKAGQTEPATH